MKFKSSILFILIFTISSFNYTLLDAKSKQVVKKHNYFTWKFKLQPYKDTKIYIDGKVKWPKIIKRDNTLALISIKILKEKLKDSIEFKCRNKKYEPLIEQINFASFKDRIFILNKKKSGYKFYKYWSTGIQPKSVTFIDDKRVVVPLLMGQGADVINIHSGEKIRLKVPQKYAKKEGFVEALVLKNNNELWISQMSANAVHVFSLDKLNYKKTIIVKGVWGKILLDDPFRDQVYYSNWESKNISVINKKTYQELFLLNAAGVPRGMMLSEDGKYLYACQYGVKNGADVKGKVVKINLNNKKIIKRIGPKGAQRHILHKSDFSVYFVSDMAHSCIYVYKMKNDRLIKKISVYSHPNTIVLSPDNKYLYVSCRGKNNPHSYLLKGLDMGRIYVIDTSTYKVLEYWEGGNQCTGLDISSDGKYITSSDFLDRAIRVYKKEIIVIPL